MRAAVLVLAAVLPLVGCSSERPGNPAVYDRIESTSDCAGLQGEFDTASASHDRAGAGSEAAEAATAYMNAADERMRELGCY